jgi:hypothetical protein
VSIAPSPTPRTDELAQSNQAVIPIGRSEKGTRRPRLPSASILLILLPSQAQGLSKKGQVVGDLGLDPETALKLMQILLRWAAYFFAGFALLALSTYVVFLYLETSQPSAKARIAKVPQPIGCALTGEEDHDLTLAETLTLAEEATVTRGDRAG